MEAVRRTVSPVVSSTPIYDELAATYLADLDLSALDRPGPEPVVAPEPAPPTEPPTRGRAKA
ncbi:hypothetical protein DFJ66_1954 [Saccharothrix variisporea]|uniref:Uncharacterized protein n=1 Tax=Saccharothrix variisporea TaxID=543527 RepID=A0A495X3G1_9PSEU|nr:hypothetical protein DFJ66_1954 [Saccharothrix variisporea]